MTSPILENTPQLSVAKPLPSQPLSYAQLASFLECFNYTNITLSVQPESGLPSVKPLPHNEGGLFSPVNRVRAFPLRTLFLPGTIEELQQAQAFGHAIYFMVNEGNGEGKSPSTGNLNCGRRVNVTKLKALFIDQDGANFDQLKKKLIEIKLMPHLIVQSSPGKHHLYFLIEEAEATPQNILYWEALQKHLASVVPELDQSMGDINQVLRLPLFFNLKPTVQESHRINIRLWPDFKKTPLYKLKTLFDRFALHETMPIDKLYVNGGGSGEKFKDKYNKFEFPLGVLTAGNRRQTITRYIEHLMENVLPLEALAEDYFILVDAFIVKYIKDTEQREFLAGGHRRKNLEQYFEDQKNYRLRKKFEQDTALAVNQLKKADDVLKGVLDDSFYTEFPGDVGLIVKEVCAYNKKLPKELAFACALAVLGTLKCERFRCYHAWPLINGLVIADSGAGKSTMKDIVEKILRASGIVGNYSRLINFKKSVQALHQELYGAGGTGITFVDESGGYLKALSSYNAPQYVTELKDYYKNATTGSDKGNTLSPGGSLSFRTPAIYGGMLSLWMLIQPEIFLSIMNYNDMADGFLPRFFVFEAKARKIEFSDHTKGRPSFVCSAEMLSMLHGYTGLLNEEQILLDVKTALDEFKKQNPKAKRDEIKFEEMCLVHEGRKMSRQRDDNIINVTITPEANDEITSYLKQIEEKANKLDRTSSENFVYVRVQEMLLRLICCCASYDFSKKECVADLELVKRCIEFQEFQVERFFNTQLLDIVKSDGEREEDLIVEAIKKHTVRYQELPSMNDVRKAIKNTRRPKNLNDVLKRLSVMGVIEELLREHKGNKDKKVKVYKISESE